ncbi:MAG: hypothetical protein JWL61_1826 [Gemmatimonadetes bacterium]|nr:hypothetical protein [Gemmatimonadota bacterium]
MAVSIPLYTVDDLDHFPDDGNRYELLDGVLLVTPLASQLHQVIVEIFSPSSKIYDRDFKRGAYLTLGVRKVWLVDADEREIQVSRADGVVETLRDRLRWTVPETDRDVVIELDELFNGLD